MVHMKLGVKQRTELYCLGCNKYYHFDCYQKYHLNARIYMQNNKIIGE